MSVSIRAPEIVYPDCDGNLMSENTLQYEWMVLITEGLKHVFRDQQHIFVACDLLWYPVQGEPTISSAPDTMVVFGRPKGHRGSYRQWEEDGIPPQVVFEIISPGNRAVDLARKLQFYDQYGVEEYYEYDPQRIAFQVWRREGEDLCLAASGPDWTASPRLGLRFRLEPEGLEILRPDGRPFRAPLETSIELDTMTAERDAATAERDAQRRRAEQLASRLRELGFDPDQIA
jgi:Uma2 family endonuclease